MSNSNNVKPGCLNIIAKVTTLDYLRQDHTKLK